MLLRSVCIGVALFVTIAISSVPLPAQTAQNPQVIVAVHDSSEAAIEGAILVLTMGTAERRATTGTDGIARFNDIEKGDWSLEVRKQGFAVAQQRTAVRDVPLSISVVLSLR